MSTSPQGLRAGGQGAGVGSAPLAGEQPAKLAWSGFRGGSIIAGADAPDAIAENVFRATDPATGSELPVKYRAATTADVERAARLAWDAFWAMDSRPGNDRAALLEAIAAKIVALGDVLVECVSTESGLASQRVASERDRTVNQLRMFAAAAREGSWVEAVIDHGDVARRPLPKPDVRRMLRPLGPVAVFGASNFPLAYSTAGGDTASALAVGCPVVVKGHPSHPGTGEMVARAISSAVHEVGMHPGVFSFLQAGGVRETDVGLELIRQPFIRAAGFTGSYAGGMALARAAAARPDPIPVFAEMGSVNPVFVLPRALEKEAGAIAEQLYSSATSSAGQMCTCPGLIFMVKSDGAEQLVRAMSEFMNQAQAYTMLNRRIREGLSRRLAEVMAVKGVELRAGSPQAAHRAPGAGDDGMPVKCSPVLLRTNFDIFQRNRTLHEEVFGPATIVVICQNEDQLVDAAGYIAGSLTGSIFTGDRSGEDVTANATLVQRLMTVLEQRVGRLIFNGVPTGVEVVPAMVHGGPYPATNQPHTSAVGTLALRRWCRPVCYQNVPESFLPPELRERNPIGIQRTVDGRQICG